VSWRVLEERDAAVSGQPLTKRYFWGVQDLDELWGLDVVSGGVASRCLATRDLRHNIRTLVQLDPGYQTNGPMGAPGEGGEDPDGGGGQPNAPGGGGTASTLVVERYLYKPYGERIAINPSDGYTSVSADDNPSTTPTGNYPISPYGFQGLRHDVGTFLIHVRRRHLDPVLGRWTQRDPLGYVDGMNLYEAFASNPAGMIDPMGTDVVADGQIDPWQNDFSTLVLRIFNYPWGHKYDKRWYNSWKSPWWLIERAKRHYVFTLSFPLERDFHEEGSSDPQTRAWITLGRFRYLVNIYDLRAWAEVGANRAMQDLYWTSPLDPNEDFVKYVLAESFADHFAGKFYGILDLDTGQYLPGFDPMDPENIVQHRAELQQGLGQATGMVRAGTKEVMYGFLIAAGASVLGEGLRFARDAGELSEPGAIPVWTRPQGWRLPRNGSWSGTAGHSDFIPSNPAELGLKPGDVVPFRRGYPDFSQWSKGSLDVPGLTGVHNHDWPLICEQLAREQGLPSISAARRWLQQQGLALHHAGGDTVQLVPLDLHDGVRHLGGAWELRNP
jgi:RHS repeat-associated protein